MRTLVCGSRGFNNGVFLFKILDATTPAPTLILSGTARGADRLGEEWARHRGVPVKRFPADWQHLGKGAGYARNLQMLDEAERVIAFWDGESRGTKHTVQEASARGIPVTLLVGCE